MGPKIDEPVNARKNGHERIWKDVKTYVKTLRRSGSPPGMREDGKVEGQKKAFPQRNIIYIGRNLRLEVSWPKEGLWNIAKKKMLEDRGALLEEDGNQLRECRAMHEEHFLSSWL